MSKNSNWIRKDERIGKKYGRFWMEFNIILPSSYSAFYSEKKIVEKCKNEYKVLGNCCAFDIDLRDIRA